MKRSEVVNCIAMLIADQVDDPSIDINGTRLYNWLAESVMSCVEDKGMVPPLNDGRYHNMDNSARTDVNRGLYYFGWEDE